jgi:hypothetical protein
MTRHRHLVFVLGAALAAAAALASRQSTPAAAAAQSKAGVPATQATPEMPGGMPGMPGMPGMSGSPGTAHDTAGAGPGTGAAADGAMAHSHMAMGPHMRMTAQRPRTADDERRADALAHTLRAAIARYRDVDLAVASGYIQFLPRIKQPIYHFTSRRNALLAEVSFDPARPTSLLYRPTPGGGFELVGAMYTAPRRFAEDQLDRRVPLSVASWHQHVNFCMPRLTALATADWHRFGLAGSIADAKACAASGGIFHPVVLGWMVHVYPFEREPAKIWAQ